MILAPKQNAFVLALRELLIEHNAWIGVREDELILSVLDQIDEDIATTDRDFEHWLGSAEDITPRWLAMISSPVKSICYRCTKYDPYAESFSAMARTECSNFEPLKLKEVSK